MPFHEVWLPESSQQEGSGTNFKAEKYESNPLSTGVSVEFKLRYVGHWPTCK